MRRYLVWLCGFLAVRLASGALQPPQDGFEQNIGEYSSDVLFEGQQIFYRNSVQLASGLSLQFVNANAASVVTGKSPLPAVLNLYHGSDPTRWRENVPHFTTVHYAQVYPGIDVEWNTQSGLPLMRILLAAGADPQQLLIRLQAPQPPGIFLSEVISYSPFFVLDNLVAYQPAGSSNSPVAVRFVQVDDTSFRPVPGAYDPSRPLTIEIGESYSHYPSVSTVNVGYDDSPLLTGYDFLAGLMPDGTPAFLSLFDGVSPGWLVPGQDGSITMAGNTFGDASPPVTADAPLAAIGGWLGRFDANGRLRASTLAGGAIKALAVDPNGGVYFATPDAIVKWAPGVTHFNFSYSIAYVSSLAASGNKVAFAAVADHGHDTTPGALESQYQGLWDVYVGTLDTLTGALRMATYIPITGAGSSVFIAGSSLALAPNGDVWIVTLIGGGGQTLVAVSADGSRLVHSESIPFVPWVSFDAKGDVLLAALTYWPNLPTSSDAPRRVACGPYEIYLRTMAADGSTLSATYTGVDLQIIAFDGLDRLFASSYIYSSTSFELQHVNTTPPAGPEIACVINSASRQPVSNLFAGELATLVGYQLGPVEQVNAAADAAGNLPVSLGGVQVTINGIPIPLVSVQQGLVTFYLPDNTPGGRVTVTDWWQGVQLAMDSSVGAGTFAPFTADGSGQGLAAALNQDGSLNGPDNPAHSGSVISLFGTGPASLASSVTVRGGAVPVLYYGSAPGLAPGVRQINVRLPQGLGSGWVQIGVGSYGYYPAVIIYVTP